MSDFRSDRRNALKFGAAGLGVIAASASALAQTAKPETVGKAVAGKPDTQVTRHRTAKVDGVDIFYREAGPANAPVVVLLHGFPTSSRMFRNLIPALSDRYRVIAPDYPGFGQSAVPDRATFKYGFAKFAELVDGLLTQLGAKEYALYVMDYGAPVGYRLALRHPERVTALVVQNGNAYEEGLKDFWKPIKAYWNSDTPENRNALRAGMTPEATKFQEFFRTKKPPTLIVWGTNDVIFPADGARAYLKDLPNAEMHLLDTGHFALEDKGDEIASLMRDFLGRKLKRS